MVQNICKGEYPTQKRHHISGSYLMQCPPFPRSARMFGRIEDAAQVRRLETRKVVMHLNDSDKPLYK